MVPALKIAPPNPLVVLPTLLPCDKVMPRKCTFPVSETKINRVADPPVNVTPPLTPLASSVSALDRTISLESAMPPGAASKTAVSKSMVPPGVTSEIACLSDPPKNVSTTRRIAGGPTFRRDTVGWKMNCRPFW